MTVLVLNIGTSRLQGLQQEPVKETQVPPQSIHSPIALLSLLRWVKYEKERDQKAFDTRVVKTIPSQCIVGSTHVHTSQCAMVCMLNPI